jgi:hypothetical protein
MEYAYPDLHTTLLTWWATVAPAARDYHIGITSGEIETTDPAFGYRLSTEPFQSPEWTNVELALRTYPDLRAQIESGVPYALGPMVVHTPTIGNAFIDTALTRFRTGKPLPIGVDLEWFNSVYLPIENYFSATSVIYRITVPLQGLICASAEIVLDESVRIVHLMLSCKIRRDERFTRWHPSMVVVIRKDYNARFVAFCRFRNCRGSPSKRLLSNRRVGAPPRCALYP